MSYMMLGAAEGDVRGQLVEKGIVVLTQANARAKQLADEIASFRNAAGLFPVGSYLTNREWAKTFKAQVEGMVVRLLTVGADGFYPWEKNPKLLNVIPDFIEAEAKQQAAHQDELIGVASVIRQAVQAFVERSVEMIGAAAQAAVNKFPPVNSGAGALLTVAGVAAAAIAAAYVWRSFR